MSEPAISIVIPAHQKVDVLPRTLRAVDQRNPGRSLHEIIVVDDNSTDGTKDFLEHWACRPGRRVVRRCNGVASAARARQAGLEAAKRRRVLLLDADVLVPPGLLEQLIAAEPRENEVLLVPTLASGASLETWTFVSSVPDPTTCSDERLFEAVRNNQRLRDERLGWPRGEGMLRGHRAPWVACWTTAVYATRARLLAACKRVPQLPGKGSEDLYMGLELFLAGADFRIAGCDSVLHMPHARDRAAEEARDRGHERQLLRDHTRLDVECLAAFGGANCHAALEALQPFTREPLVRAWPVQERWAVPSGPSLLLGAANETLRQALPSTYIADPCFADDPGPHRLPLLGLALPFEDGELDAVIIPDLNAALPEPAQCRIFEEASRVAKRVFLAIPCCLATEPPRLSASNWLDFDRPYWERSRRVSRSYFDWRLIYDADWPEARLRRLAPA
ncbi:MAG: glycosyltransferase family 2 protein [Phycisphaerales bacterium]|nr:glycosyltransferase family 2 protein [Phycisphaerales bacterium]